MRVVYSLLFLFITNFVCSQLLYYKLHDGDTINIIDQDSLKQGVWREFHNSGNLKNEVVYKNGKKQGVEISWYASGCLKQETFFNKGIIDGPITFYNKQCKKELIENYRNGVKEGIEISYYNNGHIRAEGNYKKGNLDGVYKVYTKAGKFSFESRTTTEEPDFTPTVDDTLSNAVYKVLTRNAKWKKNIIVSDLTSSMYPYARQLNTWLHLFFLKDTAQQYFVFFNDGDKKADYEKKVGVTGGVYICKAKSSDDLVSTMKHVIKKGEGGDSPENVVEAILTGLKKIRKPSQVILIADNWAKVRDINLITRVKVPVRVILCGVYDGMEINADYLNIAYKTKGSIHTIEQDIDNLQNQTINKRFNINGFDYIIKNGSIRAD